MLPSARSLALALSAALALPLGAQLGSGDTLVADLAPGPAGSKPLPRASLGDQLVFATLDATNAQAIWITDGAGSTVKLIDFPAGTGSPEHFCSVGDKVLWTAGYKLYATDGTPEGTAEFFDLTSLGFNIDYVLWSAPLGDTGTCVFTVRQVLYGLHFLVTDGTTAGTSDYIEISNAQYPRAIGDKIYFSGKFDFFSGKMEPWVTDGTAAGTYELIDIPPPNDASQPSGFTQVGDKIFFEAAGKLYMSDGTAAGTVEVYDPPGEPIGLVAWGDKLAFYSSFSPGIYATDLAGVTQQVTTAPATALVAAGPLLYFLDTSDSNYDLWRTDGTALGTIKIADQETYPFYSVPGIPLSDGRLIFGATGASGKEVYVTTGTPAGTTLLADIHAGAGSSDPSYWRRAGTNVFFRASDGALGDELHAVTVGEAGGYVVSHFGVGCGTTTPPKLTTSLTPTLGDSFGIGVTGAPSTLASLFLSADPLFLALGQGCAGQIKSPLFAGVFVTDGGGHGEVVYPIPDVPVLAGLAFYFQAALSTGTGPFGGLELTGGLEVILGP